MPQPATGPSVPDPSPPATFGEWLKRQRKLRDLTQDELSRQVGCARITIRKFEADEMRPSKQLAELLAQALEIPPGERAAFVRFARGETGPDSADSTHPDGPTLWHQPVARTTALPTGTVTFLFTDIEGSTKLAQQHRAIWEDIRRRHYDILRTAAEAHHGHVFQVSGDALCIAFATAPDAVAAAIRAQHSLHTETWAAASLKVRMGIHTGTAEARDGDYQGYLTLVRVQRVMAAAHGGQVLISHTTRDLLNDAQPDDVTLRDLGEHRLKSLLNPEHLWQVVAPGLTDDFPALDSLDAIPNNLPVQVTSFIGRAVEVRELQRLLASTRLITLTGSGGTGKTRLSLQVAAEVLDDYRDGVWFVELAQLTDPALVPPTIASVLGVREEQDRPLLATLMDWLRDRRLLLILDNCEHLIESCAKFADVGLHAAREIRILASSREALGIAGELAWRVPSLEAPNPKDQIPSETLSQYAAVKLFVERASFVNPTFHFNEVTATAVAQICYRLDGIPLAIELAAARVKAMRVEQIAERLDDRFRLLTGGSRTALPRQQTLRGMID